MDGRVQIPVIEWMKKTYGSDYVDVITEPGPDKLMVEERFGVAEVLIKKKVEISIQKHGSKVVAICGHYDCAGNPADMDRHIEQIKESVEIVKSWSLNVEVIGLWIDESWEVHKVV